MTLTESMVPPMREAALEWFGEHGRVAPTLTPTHCQGKKEQELEAILRLKPAIAPSSGFAILGCRCFAGLWKLLGRELGVASLDSKV